MSPAASDTAVASPRPATDRVLPTLNPDGSRRWLRPRLSPGRFLARRRAVAWALIVTFTVVPYLRMHGKPVILLDVVHRRFTLFGTTFLPTDTVLLMLLLVGIFLTIFWLTAVYGRVWCGWACPQTVYMEFVYRPIERLFQGRHARHPAPGAPPPLLRRVATQATFLLVSMFLGHTFLAYFVGVDSLVHWVTRPPVEHPIAFAVMAGTAALMFLDFAWFREQVCIVACPYGRFQSVLLDRRSLIVGYDHRRGEPRGPLRRGGARGAPAGGERGDCVDCGLCVATCPTGIDIRDGLQMECIHCTQCMDACDAVMDRIGRARGLIRYSTRDELAGAARRIVRPRIVLYPVLLVAVFGALAWALAHRGSAEVTLLRGLDSPFTMLPSGEVSNQVRIKLVNRSESEHQYRIELVDPGEARLIAPENPVGVSPGHAVTTTVFVTAPSGGFSHGERAIRVRIDDGAGFVVELPYRLLGPSGREG